MSEKKQLDISSIADWALKLSQSKINEAESLELKKMIFNDVAPKIRELELSQTQEIMSFMENAASVLIHIRNVCSIIRQEKLDALPTEKKEKLSKEWEEIQAKRQKAGIKETLEKAKSPEKKEKEEEVKVRKVAAQRLTAQEKAIKIIMKINPKLSKEEALAKLEGRL